MLRILLGQQGVNVVASIINHIMIDDPVFIKLPNLAKIGPQIAKISDKDQPFRSFPGPAKVYLSQFRVAKVRIKPGSSNVSTCYTRRKCRCLSGRL